jgi:predicted permease
MFLNPAIIPISIGFILYLTGLGGWFAHCGQLCADKIDVTVHGPLISASAIFNQLANVLSNSVAPTSMVLIGTRLADVDILGALKDFKVYLLLLMRLIAFPLMIMVFALIAHMFGLFTPEILLVLVILAAAPSAANTTIFAELYDGIPAFAGELVAVTTICSVITMPLIAFITSYLTSVIPVLF